jgi:hypothetical protein
MNKTFTRIAAAGTTAIAAASFAMPAFAQASLGVNPCPPGGQFSGLCGLNANNIGPFLGNLVLFLFVVAALIALFFLIWGGIKWILSGGDKSKVEAARSTIIAALIGLVVTFLSFFLLQIILGLFGISLSNLAIPNLFAGP